MHCRYTKRQRNGFFDELLTCLEQHSPSVFAKINYVYDCKAECR